MDLEDLGEFNLINRLQSRLKHHSKQVIQGIGDDCAIYATASGTHQIISTDSLMENVHFKLKTHPPEEPGIKPLAVIVSDIAAIGGTPRIAVITLGLEIFQKHDLKVGDKLSIKIDKKLDFDALAQDFFKLGK